MLRFEANTLHLLEKTLTGSGEVNKMFEILNTTVENTGLFFLLSYGPSKKSPFYSWLLIQKCGHLSNLRWVINKQKKKTHRKAMPWYSVMVCSRKTWNGIVIWWSACTKSRHALPVSVATFFSAWTKRILRMQRVPVALELRFQFLKRQKFLKKHLWQLPMYCDQNFPTSNIRNTHKIGDANAEIANGPKNVRGTTPGYSLWSYCKIEAKFIME